LTKICADLSLLNPKEYTVLSKSYSDVKDVGATAIYIVEFLKKQSPTTGLLSVHRIF